MPGAYRVMVGRNLLVAYPIQKSLPHDLERIWQRIRANRRELADLLDSRPARTGLDRGFKRRECVACAGRGNLDIAVALVPHPAGQPQRLRLLDDVPAEAHALHSTDDLEMDAVHGELLSDAKQSGQGPCDGSRIRHGSRARTRELSIADLLGDQIERG